MFLVSLCSAFEPKAERFVNLLFNVKLISCPQAGEQLVRVNQDTRLNYRVLDMRTPANQGIFRIQCQVSTVSSLCYFIFLKVL